jgi:hypothetical protein
MTEIANNPLTDKEKRIIIDMIVIDCTKVLCKVINYKAKRQAESYSTSSQQNKSLALTSTQYNLGDILDDKGTFRSSDIRKKLPKEIQNIRGADLTYINKFLVRINATTKAESNINKRGKPQTEDNNSTSSDPGPKSFSQASTYYHNLREVLSDSEAVDLIHFLLKFSGMLYKYMKHIQWILFHIIMLNADKEKALSVSKSIFPVSITTSSFNNLYHKVRSIKDIDKQLKELADTRARYYVKNHKPSGYIKLFELGGLYYQA